MILGYKLTEFALLNYDVTCGADQHFCHETLFRQAGAHLTDEMVGSSREMVEWYLCDQRDQVALPLSGGLFGWIENAIPHTVLN